MKDSKFAYKKEALLRLRKSLKVLQEAGGKSVEMTGAHLIQNRTILLNGSVKKFVSLVKNDSFLVRI